MVSYRCLGSLLNTDTSGYTLLELQVIMAVLVLIVTTTFFPLAKWIDLIRLQQAAREITTTLRLLQNQAMVEERTFYFRFVLYENTRWGYLIKKTDDKGMLEKDHTFKLLPPGITIFSTPGITELMFYPTGAPSTGLTINVTSTYGRGIGITVLPATGRVKMEEYSK